MKVAEKSNGAVQGTTERREEAVSTASQTESANSSANSKSKEDAEKPKVENKEITNEVKESEKPKEFAQITKPVLNLEATLKVVNDLHRRSIQRDNLLNRIHQLEAFEIALIEEGDELETNHFQGCQLIISDDKGRKFVTQTAGLIKLVSEFIHTACMEKLGEIEANIVFPRA